jgi:hypothetical protein
MKASNIAETAERKSLPGSTNEARHEHRNCRRWKCRPCARRWLTKTGHKVTMAVREPASSKAIELKKQGFGVAAAKDEAAKRPSRRREE